MKLDQITLHSYSLPYRQRVQWSDTEETQATYVLLRIVDDSGAVGYAEATPKPTWSGYTPALLIETLRTLFLPLLRRHDLRQPEVLASRLQLIPGHAQARGMVESSLWALRHRPTAGRDVPMSCTLTRQAPAAMAAQAVELAATLGVRWFKLKGGQGFETDLAAVRAVRTALPAASIYVDANSAYDQAQIADYSAALATYDVALLEDPCPFSPQDFGGLAQRSRLPLLVDLAARDAGAASHYASHGAAAISVKPGRYGIAEALRVASAARAANKPVCLGLFGESDLGTLLNLRALDELPAQHLAAPAELSFFVELRGSVLAHPPTIRSGVLHLPATRLTDSEIDFSRMQRHACD